jgi:ArsR family transcriptional regulator
LAVSQPTVSEHLRILSQAKLLDGRRIKKWTFYKRNESQIAQLKKAISAKL